MTYASVDERTSARYEAIRWKSKEKHAEREFTEHSTNSRIDSFTYQHHLDVALAGYDIQYIHSHVPDVAHDPCSANFLASCM